MQNKLKAYKGWVYFVKLLWRWEAQVKVFSVSVLTKHRPPHGKELHTPCVTLVCWVGTTPAKVPKDSFFFCFEQLELTSNFFPQVYKTHELVNAGISDITIRPDKKILATAGWDHRIRIFGWKRLKPLAVLDYHTATIHCVSFSDHSSPRDRLLAAGSKDQRISVWSIYAQTWHVLHCHGLGKQDWESNSEHWNSNVYVGKW